MDPVGSQAGRVGLDRRLAVWGRINLWLVKMAGQ